MELILSANSNKEPIRETFLSRAPFMNLEDGRVTRDLNELLELYKQDPMAQRAIDTKAKDLFEAGFKIVGLEEEEDKKGIITELTLFQKKVHWKEKGPKIARDAMVFGNGFAEILYVGDRATKPSNPPLGATDISDIVMVSPRQMLIVEDNEIESPNYGKIIGYLSINPISGGMLPDRLIIDKSEIGNYVGKLIHPDRILHMKFNSLSDSHLGMSQLEPAYWVLKSKIDADKVLGTIMVRFAKPIIDFEIAGGTKEEIKKAGLYGQVMNKNPNEVSYIAHDDKLKMEIKGAQGKAIPPRDYMDYLVEQLAVCFGVPKTLIIGAQQGSISGSDLNLVSYFQSLEKDQETIISPFMFTLFNRLWQVRYQEDIPLELDIEWNRLYSDEIASEKFKTLGTQNMISAVKMGLIPKKGAQKKLCEMYGIKYEEADSAYEDTPATSPPTNTPNLNPAQQVNPSGIKEGGEN